MRETAGNKKLIMILTVSMVTASGAFTYNRTKTQNKSVYKVLTLRSNNKITRCGHGGCRSLSGRVYVSHIVDFLRHTTSRSSEDSGLEDLCNMLDPEHKDVSIDLDTYHAVMKEWIDDCRNNGY